MVDKQETGEIQILVPPILRGQGLSFCPHWGSREGRRAQPELSGKAFATGTSASWISFGMPSPPKCQGMCRKDSVSKIFPEPAKLNQWISEEN